MGGRRKGEIGGYRYSGKTRLHVAMAEKALGKPLPKGAVVHHADGTKSENSALVICQDQRYHLLLHARARIVAKGGNPDTRRFCKTCNSLRMVSDFRTRQSGPKKGSVVYPCIECNKSVLTIRRERIRSNVA